MTNGEAQEAGARGVCAVVLDLDGVLVDSEAAHLESWVRVAHDFGHELPTDFEEAALGVRMVDAAKWLADRLGEDASALLAYRDEVGAGLAKRIEPFPETPEALGLLRETGVHLLVGSSGTRRHVDHWMRALSLDGVVEGSVSGDDVRNGKPAPDIFLRCAEKVDVPRTSIAVFEDSPRGVRAAKRAGLLAVGVERGGTRLSEADHRVQDLREGASWVAACAGPRPR